MSKEKNRLSVTELAKQKSHQQAQEAEAKAALSEKDPWEDQEKADRISMRIEPSLKAAYLETLPKYASLTDALREHMIEQVKRSA